MEELIAKLKACEEIPFKHIAWSEAPTDKYGVYYESEKHYLPGDNKHSGTVTTMFVDLFTKSDGTAHPAVVENILEESDCSWYCDTIQYEEDTGFLHYSWAVECVG